MTPSDAEVDALPSRVDVAVIGGGPAGASTALALARLGARVALLDRGATRPHLGESLPPAATPLLQDAGVWADPEVQGHQRAPGIRTFWGGSEAMEVDFLHQPYGTGWHLDRGRFEVHLVQCAREAGALWSRCTRVHGLARTADGWWRLTLDHPEGARPLDAATLVDASGRARWVARALGVGAGAYDRLVATVVTYAPSAPDLDQRTVVEAVADGWWYATPLPDGRLVVAYLSDADLAAHRRVRTRVGWEAALRGTTEIGAHVAQRSAHLDEGPRPIGADSSGLETVCGAQWWAVGDAAVAHDPLSSQGLMAALDAGMRLGRAIAGGADGAAYAAWVERTYAHYLAQWLGYYALEQRWPAAPFWQRRHTLWRQVMQE